MCGLRTNGSKACKGFVLIQDSSASWELHLSLSLVPHLGLIPPCRVLPRPGSGVCHKEECLQNPGSEHYYCFTYGPVNPDVCNCRAVLVIPSVWEHCSVCLKQYCEGIPQTSNLSSFSWAVWNNEEQWTIVLVVQARPRAEVALDLS